MSEEERTAKIPAIIELRKSGASWEAIAEATGIPRRSLYNLRRSEGFLDVANEIWLDIWADIQKQRQIDQHYNLNESIKNQIRLFMLLSGTSLDAFTGEGAKTMECDETCQHYTLMITERRTAMSKMCEMMKPTREQWDNIIRHFPIEREPVE